MRFPGILPAVTTPFDAGGAIDHAALDANLSALLEAGVHGLVAAGTMGEAGSLSAAERGEVVRAAVRAADGHVPVVAGVSAGTPDQAAGYAADAAAAGADAVMLLPPVGYRGDGGEILAHYATVAAASDLPIMAYNNPEASGTDMPSGLIVELAARVERVVAVKECSGDTRRIPALRAAAPRLEILVGGDDWALEGFAGGATGWVSGVADCAPRECVALYEACRDGELEAARELYARLLPLARLDMTPKLVQYFKAAMDALGYAGGPCRAPRLPLSAADQVVLGAALETLGSPAGAGVAGVATA